MGETCAYVADEAPSRRASTSAPKCSRVLLGAVKPAMTTSWRFDCRNRARRHDYRRLFGYRGGGPIGFGQADRGCIGQAFKGFPRCPDGGGTDCGFPSYWLGCSGGPAWYTRWDHRQGE